MLFKDKRHLSFREFLGGTEYTVENDCKLIYFFIVLVFSIATVAIAFILSSLKIGFIGYGKIKILIAFLVTFLIIEFKGSRESLLILPGFGLQISSKGLIFEDRRFVSKFSLKDVYIHEALLLNRVVFYLLIELRESNDIIVPFKNSSLSLNDLINIKNQIAKQLIT